MELVIGANTAIPTDNTNIDISLSELDTPKIDFSAYTLSSITNKVRGDDDMIFYGQLNNQKSTVILSNKNKNTVRFSLDLQKVDPDIGKIAICATCTEVISNFSQISNLKLNISSRNKKIIAHGKIEGNQRTEAALIIGEFYRHQQGWKFRLVGQGFNGGLKPLAEHYGVEIESSTAEPESSINNPIPHVPPSAQNNNPPRKKSFISNLVDIPLKALDKRNNLKKFKVLLIDYLRDGVLTEDEKNSLNLFCQSNDLIVSEAMDYAKNEVNSFLQMTLASITSDKEITPENKALIENLCTYLNADNNVLFKIKSTIARIEQLQNIRLGNVQPCQVPGLITKNGEIVFCNIDNVTYYLGNDDGYEGKLNITSEKIVFTGYGFGANAPLAGLLSLMVENGIVYITSKTKKSTFVLIPRDDESADLIEAYIEQASKRFHRKLDFNTSQKQSRHIPQTVKSQVWEICQGKCVQCNVKDYLEFDHIIPFSKGGANTVNNVQILCRRCNLIKRDRV